MEQQLLEDFVKKMKDPIVKAGQLAKSMQGKVENIGKEVEKLSSDNERLLAVRTAKTIIDEQVQEILLKELVKVLDPKQIHLDAEEDTASRALFTGSGQALTLVIDPIDGTLEYLKGNDTYSVCLGLIDQDKLCLAIIYFPARDDFYLLDSLGKSLVLKNAAYQDLSVARDIKLPTDSQKRVFANSRVPQALITGLKNLGYQVSCDRDVSFPWSEALLGVLSGEFSFCLFHTPQVRDILLGGLIENIDGGFALDWSGKALDWPSGGRVPRALFGAGSIPQDVSDLVYNYSND